MAQDGGGARGKKFGAPKTGYIVVSRPYIHIKKFKKNFCFIKILRVLLGPPLNCKNYLDCLCNVRVLTGLNARFQLGVKNDCSVRFQR